MESLLGYHPCYIDFLTYTHETGWGTMPGGEFDLSLIHIFKKDLNIFKKCVDIILSRGYYIQVAATSGNKNKQFFENQIVRQP